MDPISMTMGALGGVLGGVGGDAGSAGAVPPAGPSATSTSDASIRAGTRNRIGGAKVNVNYGGDKTKGAAAESSTGSPLLVVLAVVAIVALLILALIFGA